MRSILVFNFIYYNLILASFSRYVGNSIETLTECNISISVYLVEGYTRDEDPVGSGEFWPAGSGSGTFSPNPDPTCNNGLIKLLSKYNPEFTN